MLGAVVEAWRRREVMLYGLVAALFLAGCWTFSAWTIDDSYISYRYAWNLASGDGLVFNPGEWVEGYSNPLWVLLLSVPAMLGIPPHWSGKVLGIAAGLAGLTYAWWGLRRVLEASLSTTFAMGLWLATHMAWLLYSTSGMETPLFALGIVAMGVHLAGRQWWPAAVWCAVAGLTRPEGLLYLGPFVLVLLVDPSGPLRRGRWHDGLAVLVPIGALGGWRLLRWLLYGTTVPNTWHAKNYGRRDLWERLEHNWPGALDTVWSGGEVLLGFGLGFALVVAGVVLLLRRPRTWGLALVPGCLFVFLVVGGSDWMSLARFLVPGLPVFAILAFHALSFLDSVRVPFGGVAVWGVTAALVGVSLHQQTEVVVDLPRGIHHNPAMDAQGHAALGHHLRDRLEPGDDKVLLNEIGAVGYFSEAHVLDTLGLVHADVPQLHTRDADSLTEHFFRQYPRFVALHDHRSRRKREMYSRDKRFLAWMERSGLYEPAGTFPLSSWRSYLLYERVQAPPTEGEGLSGTYRAPGVEPHTRVDGLVHFAWERGAPMEGFPEDGFEVTWTGCLILESPAVVRALPDGGRAEVLIDGTPTSPRRRPVPAGQHDIEVQYRHDRGDAGFTLAWGDDGTAVAPSALRPEPCPD